MGSGTSHNPTCVPFRRNNSPSRAENYFEETYATKIVNPELDKLVKERDRLHELLLMKQLRDEINRLKGEIEENPDLKQTGDSKDFPVLLQKFQKFLQELSESSNQKIPEEFQGFLSNIPPAQKESNKQILEDSKQIPTINEEYKSACH